jgi:hypothetical protein
MEYRYKIRNCTKKIFYFYDWNNISNKECKHICESLENNKQIRGVVIQGKEISKQKCKYIYDIFKMNKTIEFMMLRFITDNEGYEYIFKLLKYNNALKKVIFELK